MVLLPARFDSVEGFWRLVAIGAMEASMAGKDIAVKTYVDLVDYH
jgi:hypothetical protein